jgi:thiaminase
MPQQDAQRHGVAGPVSGALGGSGSEPSFTAAVWERIADVRAAVDDLPFLHDLDAGSLTIERFTYYLRQDALYLSGYARALARCSQLAPVPAAQQWWAVSARSALAVESALHESWLSAPGEPGKGPAEESPTTAAYLNHLYAVAGEGEYGALVAAVLPCFWLYCDVGTRLHARVVQRPDAAEHPYRRWIDTYADESFAASTAWVVAEADLCSETAGGQALARMVAAFERSARYEWMFWDAAYRQEAWPVGGAADPDLRRDVP